MIGSHGSATRNVYRRMKARSTGVKVSRVAHPSLYMESMVGSINPQP